jgi:hypothetical protein
MPSRCCFGSSHRGSPVRKSSSLLSSRSAANIFLRHIILSSRLYKGSLQDALNSFLKCSNDSSQIIRHCALCCGQLSDLLGWAFVYLFSPRCGVCRHESNCCRFNPCCRLHWSCRLLFLLAFENSCWRWLAQKGLM